jgi:hypothetical protein
MERRCVTGRASENGNIGRRVFGEKQVANDRVARLYIAGRLYIEGRVAIPFVSAVPMKLEGGGMASEESSLGGFARTVFTGPFRRPVRRHESSDIGSPNRWKMLVMILDSSSVAG